MEHFEKKLKNLNNSLYISAIALKDNTHEECLNKYIQNKKNAQENRLMYCRTSSLRLQS